MKYILALLLVGCVPSRAMSSALHMEDNVFMYLPGDGRMCSAVMVSEHVALTAGHCLGKSKGALMTAPPTPVSVAKDAPKDDIAALGFDRRAPRHAEIVDDYPPAGSGVYIVGYGCHLGKMYVRDGTWLNAKDPWDQWLVRGDVCPGDSGGGLFDMHGRLLGILSATSPGRAHVVPIEAADTIFAD